MKKRKETAQKKRRQQAEAALSDVIEMFDRTYGKPKVARCSKDKKK